MRRERLKSFEMRAWFIGGIDNEHACILLGSESFWRKQEYSERFLKESYAN